jgi:hypothetical protein
MPALRNLDAVMFVDEPPEFEYRDGMFFIRQRISETCIIERVMRPSIFMQSIARAAAVAREHRLGGAEIIPVDFDSKFERVFPKDKSA